MPTVSNNSILEFVTPSSHREDELSLDSNVIVQPNPVEQNGQTSNSSENLTVFGKKPNAIVRPLQRETPAIEDGINNDGFAKRIKQIENDKTFLDKLAQKRHQFNKVNRELLPREPVKTVSLIFHLSNYLV